MRLRKTDLKMTENNAIQIVVDGRKVHCTRGQTVAGALLAQRIYQFRTSPRLGHARGAFCMMGACQECAVLIDGAIRRACQTEVAPGLRVDLLGAGQLPSEVME